MEIRLRVAVSKKAAISCSDQESGKKKKERKKHLLACEHGVVP